MLSFWKIKLIISPPCFKSSVNSCLLTQLYTYFFIPQSFSLCATHTELLEFSQISLTWPPLHITSSLNKLPVIIENAVQRRPEKPQLLQREVMIPSSMLLDQFIIISSSGTITIITNILKSYVPGVGINTWLEFSHLILTLLSPLPHFYSNTWNNIVIFIYICLSH